MSARTAARVLVACTGLMLALGALPVAAQQHEEERLRAALNAALAELQRTEAAALAAFDGNLAAIDRAIPAADEQRRSLAHTRALLDTVVFETRWGPDELLRLRRTYPGSPLFELYGARLALATSRPDSARAILLQLAGRMPALLDVHTLLAEAHEALGDDSEALRALTRALELDPENGAVYARLYALHRRAGSTESLLAQVRRLQARVPRSRFLIEHEVDLLHRLGRAAEARAAAERLRELDA